MGIDRASAEFLGFASARGVRFTTTLTIGRQSRFGSADAIVTAIRRSTTAPISPGLIREIEATPWADAIFSALGAEHVDALDVSDFEGATVLHDMNLPIGDALSGQWACVFDGGTSEHVFNTAVALENTMRLVAPEGHLIIATPANQQLGHGFYQFSPELYFRALCPENGFRLDGVYLHHRSIRSSWFRLVDPAVAGHRCTMATLGEATLFVLARRVGPAAIRVIPQQSDYARAWIDRGPPTTRRPTFTAKWNGRVARMSPWLVPAAQTIKRALRGPGRDVAIRIDLSALTMERRGSAAADPDGSAQRPPASPA